MDRLKVVYFGTPDFSAELLKKLGEDKSLPIEIIGVVTQPDKKVGRKQILTPSPVKKVAGELGLPVILEYRAQIEELEKADLGLLFAYGEILPNEILERPKNGFWNVHPSLLPKYRGPSPIATPLINGDNETGVTIIKMDSELDHGMIISQQKCYIFPLHRRDQLTERLVELSYKMLGELFGKYAGNMGEVPMSPQDHNQATYTKKLTKQDGYIEINKLKKALITSSPSLFNSFRGLYPWPGIWTTLPDGKRLKITKIHKEDGRLVIKKVQLEGKNEIEFATFLAGYPGVF